MNFQFGVDYRNYLNINYSNNQPEASLNPEAVQNLQIARSIVDYVKDAVPFSHNNHIRGQIFTNHHSRDSFLVIADDQSKRYNAFKDETELNDLQEDWEMLAKEIVKLRVGPCYELCIAGYAYGVQKLNLKNIEIFDLVNGDHDILVYGRDPLSNPKDYKQWGPSCIVGDVWLESCYSSSQIESKLYEYAGIFERNGRSIPHLIPFNPNYHSLKLLLSSNPEVDVDSSNID